MSKIPLIGILGDTNTVHRGGPDYGVDVWQTEVHLAYAERIAAAGGIPMVMPNLDPKSVLQMLSKVDGVLMAGGYDHLSHEGDGCYGGPLSEDLMAKLEQGDRRRQSIEGVLIRTAVQMNKPLFGICRGMQAMNVTFGGTLYADIPSQIDGAIDHNRTSNPQRFQAVHEVDVTGVRLADIVHSRTIAVNSRHHQAGRDIGRNISRAGVCRDDNVVEAIQIHNHPFAIGVQWHPEDMEDEASELLFKAFVKACSVSL